MTNPTLRKKFFPEKKSSFFCYITTIMIYSPQCGGSAITIWGRYDKRSSFPTSSLFRFLIIFVPALKFQKSHLPLKLWIWTKIGKILSLQKRANPLRELCRHCCILAILHKKSERKWVYSLWFQKVTFSHVFHMVLFSRDRMLLGRAVDIWNFPGHKNFRCGLPRVGNEDAPRMLGWFLT